MTRFNRRMRIGTAAVVLILVVLKITLNANDAYLYRQRSLYPKGVVPHIPASQPL